MKEKGKGKARLNNAKIKFEKHFAFQVVSFIS